MVLEQVHGDVIGSLVLSREEATNSCRSLGPVLYTEGKTQIVQTDPVS